MASVEQSIEWELEGETDKRKMPHVGNRFPVLWLPFYEWRIFLTCTFWQVSEHTQLNEMCKSILVVLLSRRDEKGVISVFF
jgi:hypothetical protein